MNDRGKRRADDHRVIENRLGFVKTVLKRKRGGTMSDGRLEFLSAQKNRLAVKHPLDCGNTKCGTCHGHKLTGEPKEKYKLKRGDDE